MDLNKTLYRFRSQTVRQRHSFIAATTPSEKLLSAGCKDGVDVLELRSEEKELEFFLRMKKVVEIIHCAAGNYLLVMEAVKFEGNYGRKVSAFVNWEKEGNAGEKVSSRSVEAGNIPDDYNDNEAYQLRLPLFGVTSMTCCQVGGSIRPVSHEAGVYFVDAKVVWNIIFFGITGNVLLGLEHKLYLFLKKKIAGKPSIFDFELWIQSIYLSFIPLKILMVDELVSVMNRSIVYVFQYSRNSDSEEKDAIGSDSYDVVTHNVLCTDLVRGEYDIPFATSDENILSIGEIAEASDSVLMKIRVRNRIEGRVDPSSFPINVMVKRLSDYPTNSYYYEEKSDDPVKIMVFRPLMDEKNFKEVMTATVKVVVRDVMKLSLSPSKLIDESFAAVRLKPVMMDFPNNSNKRIFGVLCLVCTPLMGYLYYIPYNVTEIKPDFYKNVGDYLLGFYKFPAGLKDVLLDDTTLMALTDNRIIIHSLFSNFMEIDCDNKKVYFPEFFYDGVIVGEQRFIDARCLFTTPFHVMILSGPHSSTEGELLSIIPNCDGKPPVTLYILEKPKSWSFLLEFLEYEDPIDSELENVLLHTMVTFGTQLFRTSVPANSEFKSNPIYKKTMARFVKMCFRKCPLITDYRRFKRYFHASQKDVFEFVEEMMISKVGNRSKSENEREMVVYATPFALLLEEYIMDGTTPEIKLTSYVGLLIKVSNVSKCWRVLCNASLSSENIFENDRIRQIVISDLRNIIDEICAENDDSPALYLFTLVFLYYKSGLIEECVTYLERLKNIKRYNIFELISRRFGLLVGNEYKINDFGLLIFDTIPSSAAGIFTRVLGDKRLLMPEACKIILNLDSRTLESILIEVIESLYSIFPELIDFKSSDMRAILKEVAFLYANASKVISIDDKPPTNTIVEKTLFVQNLPSYVIDIYKTGRPRLEFQRVMELLFSDLLTASEKKNIFRKMELQNFSEVELTCVKILVESDKKEIIQILLDRYPSVTFAYANGTFKDIEDWLDLVITIRKKFENVPEKGEPILSDIFQSLRCVMNIQSFQKILVTGYPETSNEYRRLMVHHRNKQNLNFIKQELKDMGRDLLIEPCIRNNHIPKSNKECS